MLIRSSLIWVYIVCPGLSVGSHCLPRPVSWSSLFAQACLLVFTVCPGLSLGLHCLPRPVSWSSLFAQACLLVFTVCPGLSLGLHCLPRPVSWSSLFAQACLLVFTVCPGLSVQLLWIITVTISNDCMIENSATRVTAQHHEAQQLFQTMEFSTQTKQLFDEVTFISSTVVNLRQLFPPRLVVNMIHLNCSTNRGAMLITM